MSPVHIHLVLNHVPILLLWLGLGTILLNPIFQSQVLIRYGLSLIVLSALVALPVYFTGGNAEEAVEQLPQVSETYIENHEDAAKTSLTLVEIAGLLSLIALWLHWKRGGIPKGLWILLLLILAGASASITWTGNLGGQIRHSEIREPRGVINAAPHPESESEASEAEERH